MDIAWEAYLQMIVNDFFFGSGLMAAFAAGAFVVAIMALTILKVVSSSRL